MCESGGRGVGCRADFSPPYLLNMNEAARQQYLAAMGIQVWDTRDVEVRDLESEKQPEILEETEVSNIQPVPDVSSAGWDELQSRVSTCMACALHSSRIQTVFGVGDRQADLLIIGEAPGAEEDRQGEPFVGRAGQLLNEMLFSIGFQREQVFIANILKCRPPDNRDPRPEEVLHCESYLKRQVELLSPKLIIAVGRIAAQNLLKTDTGLARLRGKCHTFGDTNIPVVVTYHPAYLLRKPTEKSKAWDDLCYAMQEYKKQ